MIATLMHYLPYGLSAITIYMTLLAGNKNPKAWAVGLVGQLLWLIWILWDLNTRQGLLPMNAALWIVYARNHLKWNKKHERKDGDQDLRKRLDHHPV